MPVFSRSREAIEPPVPVKELISAHVAQDVEARARARPRARAVCFAVSLRLSDR